MKIKSLPLGMPRWFSRSSAPIASTNSTQLRHFRFRWKHFCHLGRAFRNWNKFLHDFPSQIFLSFYSILSCMESCRTQLFPCSQMFFSAGFSPSKCCEESRGWRGEKWVVNESDIKPPILLLPIPLRQIGQKKDNAPDAARIPKSTAKIVLYIVDLSPKTEINCRNDLLFSAKNRLPSGFLSLKVINFRGFLSLKWRIF